MAGASILLENLPQNICRSNYAVEYFMLTCQYADLLDPILSITVPIGGSW